MSRSRYEPGDIEKEALSPRWRFLPTLPTAVEAAAMCVVDPRPGSTQPLLVVVGGEADEASAAGGGQCHTLWLPMHARGGSDGGGSGDMSCWRTVRHGLAVPRAFATALVAVDCVHVVGGRPSDSMATNECADAECLSLDSLGAGAGDKPEPTQGWARRAMTTTVKLGAVGGVAVLLEGATDEPC